MIFSLEQTVVVAGVALLAGALSSLAGGGNLLILPSLMLAGMPAPMALGTGRMLTTTGLLTSSWIYCKRGLFKPKLWLAAIIATAAGAGLGAATASMLNAEQLNRFLPLILLLMTGYLAWPKKTVSPNTANTQIQTLRYRKNMSGLLGTILGAYSGLVGAATGAVWTTLMMSIFNMEVLEASAISRVMCTISNAVALIVFIMAKHVDYQVGFTLVAMSSLGAWLGSKLALQYGQHLIRPVLILSTSLMSLKLLHSAWLA